MKIKNQKPRVNVKHYVFMSTLMVSTLLFGFLVQKVGASFVSEVVADGAVAHWSFEESSGDLLDQIGVNNGTVQGSPSRQQAAQHGNGYDFTSSLSQRINLPDEAFSTLSEGAIEAIAKVDSTSSTDQIIFAQGDSASGGLYQVILAVRDGRARLQVRNSGASNSITGNTVLTTGQYYHFVAQMGPSGMQLFVNGVEDTPYATSGDMGVRTWFSQHSALAATSTYSIGYINRSSPTGYFDGTIDEVAIYGAPQAQAVWASHYNAAFGEPATEGEIAITNPSAYKIYQRDGSDVADIEVSGTYTDTPTAIEYQVDTGAWATLDNSLTGGIFSGTIPNVAAGQHTISVRYANDTSTTASVANIRVGDVFGWIGQSNADGRFGNAQPYTGAGASIFDRSGSWLNLTSGYQSPAAEGSYSVLPRVASLIEAHTGVPVGFVAETQGRTGLVSPDPDWAPGGTNYENFINAVINSDVNNIKAFLWYQGGREISNNISQAVYEAAEQGLLSNLRADTGFSLAPLISANKSMQEDKLTASIDAIRMAKIANWDNAVGIYAGPTGHDQLLADGAHWSTNAQGATLAGRWWRAIGNALYSTPESARGPRFSSATYASNSLTVTFTGGAGSLQNQSDNTGWQVVDANGIRTISSSAGTSNTVTLTLDQSLVAPVTVTYASGNSASGSTLTDTGTYPTPPEPFLGKTVTSAGAPNNPPTITGTPLTSVDEGVAYNFVPTGSDNDGDTLTYSITNRPSWATFNPATGVLSGTPSSGDAGVYPGIQISVTDGKGGSDSLDTFSLTVNAVIVNQSPSITSGGGSATASASANENQAAATTVVATDPDGDTLTYTIVGGTDESLFSVGSSSGVLAFVSNPDYESPMDSNTDGVYVVVVRVSDGNGGTDTQTISISVTDVNEIPVAVNDNGVTTEGSSITTTVLANDNDPDGDTLEIESVTAGGSGTTVINGNNTVTYTPDPGYSGTDTYTYVASDGRGGTASATVTIVINPVVPGNNSPTVTGTPATAATVGVAYSFVPTGSDVDGDTLTYAITNRPSWASFNTLTGALNGMPSSGDTGSYANIQISVSDGNGGSAMLVPFSITVSPVVSNTDEDNVSDEVENAAPNSGDGNNDGAVDAMQDHVTSLPYSNGRYVSLVVDSSCSLSDVSIVSEAAQQNDPSFDYSENMVDFTAECSSNGYTSNVTLYFYGVDSAGKTVRKYNPSSQAYGTIENANLANQTIGGVTVAVVNYEVRDGEALDIDGIANGVIVDPVGLGSVLAENTDGTNDSLDILAPNTGVGMRHASSSVLVIAAGAVTMLCSLLILGVRRLSLTKRS